jgi:methyl halide transferase
MFRPLPGKLQETFANADFSEHGSKWNQLWEESYTPWDRGGPSMALNDLLEEAKHLFLSTKAKKTALVPGCGMGHDVLLLAAFGYDVYGLDYSASAAKSAIDNQAAVGNDEVYRPRQGVEAGKITWLTGDFFSDDWLQKADVGGKFDLIFDYTVSRSPLFSISLLRSGSFCVPSLSPPGRRGQSECPSFSVRRED